MKTLIVNCGSSSLKCGLYDVATGERLASGRADRIGMRDAGLECKSNDKSEVQALSLPDHAAALASLWDAITRIMPRGEGLYAEVAGVGHRIVHGADRFTEAIEVDQSVEAAIEELIPLAPLHNRLSLSGISAARELLPAARQFAVFDTAFHHTLPPAAYLYALPYEWYEKEGVRRYGFHGTSHRWVAERAAAICPDHASKLIVCHLGAGCSTAAIRDGHSLDTSMGMTPLEGLVMATRSGDVDAGVIAFIAKQRGLEINELEEILNRKSGLFGISGLSGDIQQLEQHASEGNARAELALEMFAHRVRKYIGAHNATLGGATAIAFTGGAGENSASLRSRILRGLDGLGMALGPAANARCQGREAIISTTSSPITLLVIQTDEESVIAGEVQGLLLAAG